MTRRSGATLVEVLVTIFVMAIGLIALLTLFPIGALRMADAVKDSRSALAAANAEALAIARNLRNDGQIVGLFTRPYAAAGDAELDGASYPVYMDPIGVRTYGAGLPNNYRDYVGGLQDHRIRRVQPAFIINTPGAAAQVRATLQSYSLLDDLTFGPNGTPVDGSGRVTGTTGAGPVLREGRYSWALMFKRPKLATQSVVDMTVVVYSGRPMQLSSGMAVQFGEGAYEGRDGVEGGNTVTTTWPAARERPNIKKGTWILDATWEQAGAGRTRYGPVHGHFYRVVNYTETSTTSMLLQLERPLKAPIQTSAPPDQRTGRIIVMDNVVEVFEKGPGWLP